MILESGLVLFFCILLSSFLSTIYWRDYLFYIVYFFLLCHRLIDHISTGLFLDFSILFHWSICLFLCHIFIFKFFFLFPLQLGCSQFSSLSDLWSVLLYPLICFLFPLVYFSFQLLYASALIGSFFLYFLFLIEVLTEFIHFSHSVVNIFMTITLNFLISDRLLISIWFSSFSGVLFCSFVWNIFLCHLILSYSLFGFFVLTSQICLLVLKVVALRKRYHVVPSSSIPLVTRTRCSMGIICVCCIYSAIMAKLWVLMMCWWLELALSLPVSNDWLKLLWAHWWTWLASDTAGWGLAVVTMGMLVDGASPKPCCLLWLLGCLGG